MKRRLSPPDTVSLAGWLFADLLLGLAMIFFVFNTVGSQPAPTPTPVMITETPTASPTSTATPTPIPTPIGTLVAIPGPALEQTPVTTILTTNIHALLGPEGQAKDAERARVRAQIREYFGEFVGLKAAGMVLTFGRSPDWREGARLAAEVNSLLVTELPQVFGGAALRNFYSIQDDPDMIGTVKVEVYFSIQ